MPRPHQKHLRRLTLLTLALAAQYVAAQTACEKAATMWNEQILPSRYAQLPPLESPGLFDLLKLASVPYSIKAFTNGGDELETGRRKLIHAFGAEARLRLEIAPEAAPRYSGFFQQGAPCLIGRFSLASKPDSERSIPALALKFFVDGDAPSVNLHLMHSVDGQIGHNFFGETFSNILPPAESFATRLLDKLFGGVAVELGAKDPNPGRLTLEHLAATQADGARIATPETPYRLLLRPTATARALMQNASAAMDFRVELAKLAEDQALYDIYALDAGEPIDNASPLGRLILTSPVVSSRFGDEKLYFQHQMERH